MTYNTEALLNILRKRTNGKTQREVAEELGISPTYLCDILSGKRNISNNLAKKLGFSKITVLYERKKEEK